ncbi:hypothetical protein ACOMHN_053215 [Nucella lapillus]
MACWAGLWKAVFFTAVCAWGHGLLGWTVESCLLYRCLCLGAWLAGLDCGKLSSLPLCVPGGMACWAGLWKAVFSTAVCAWGHGLLGWTVESCLLYRCVCLGAWLAGLDCGKLSSLPLSVPGGMACWAGLWKAVFFTAVCAWGHGLLGWTVESCLLYRCLCLGAWLAGLDCGKLSSLPLSVPGGMASFFLYRCLCLGAWLRSFFLFVL